MNEMKRDEHGALMHKGFPHCYFSLSFPEADEGAYVTNILKARGVARLIKICIVAYLFYFAIQSALYMALYSFVVGY